MRGRWHSLAISIGAKISSHTQWPVSRPRFCYYFSLPETSTVRYEKWEIFSVLWSQLCDFVGARPKPSSTQHRIIIHLSDFLIFPIAFALLFSVLNLKTHSLCFSAMFLVFQHEKFVYYFVIHQRLHNGWIDIMKAQTISWPFDLLDSHQLSSLMIFVHHEREKKWNYWDDRIVYNSQVAVVSSFWRSLSSRGSWILKFWEERFFDIEPCSRFEFSTTSRLDHLGDVIALRTSKIWCDVNLTLSISARILGSVNRSYSSIIRVNKCFIQENNTKQ